MNLLNVIAFIITTFPNVHATQQKLMLQTRYNEKINNYRVAVQRANPEESKKFKGIDSINLQSWLVQKSTIDYKQKLFTNYLNGKTNLQDLTKTYALYNYNLKDTINLYHGKIENLVFVLTGIDKKGNKVVIVDADNNKDFGNDKVFKYSLKEQDKCINDPAFRNKIPFIKVWYEHFNGKNLVRKSLLLKAFPYKNYYNSYDDSLEKKLETVLLDNSFKYQKLHVFNKDIKLYFNNEEIFPQTYNEKNTLVSVGFGKKHSIQKDAYRINEDIPLGNNRYIRFDSIDKNGTSVTYHTFTTKTSKGISVGQTFPSHEFYNYKDNINEKLSFKGNYILIDFWGSWCHPCIEAMPQLKKIYDNFSTEKEIQFLSIAYDEKDKVDQIESILKSASIPWQTYIDDKDLKDKSFEKLFHVLSYPTTIILDKNLRVIFKSTGIDEGLTSLNDFINKL
jgi:thiol-disulfide isomerase/thioredoxin